MEDLKAEQWDPLYDDAVNHDRGLNSPQTPHLITWARTDLARKERTQSPVF